MLEPVPPPRTKLIEVAFPVEAVGEHAAREKSIRHGHPSTLHLWWSRKPLAAARAVLLAQLIDDPSAHPDRYPTAADQDAERARLLDLVARSSAWSATQDGALLAQVRAEVAAAVAGLDDPIVWDPFAGGGSIPLEAQRLGVPALSGDLNPVAVLLQRALLELPARWGSARLAAAVRHHGALVLDAATTRLRAWYPQVPGRQEGLLPGEPGEVAAYLWVRSARCPGCAATVPLLSNPWLRRGRGGVVGEWLAVRADGTAVAFSIETGSPPTGSTGRGVGFGCPACRRTLDAAELQRQAAVRGGFGLAPLLRCVVLEGGRGAVRPLLTEDQLGGVAAVSPDLPVPAGLALPPDAALDPAVTNAPSYGVPTADGLHLPRQRVALAVFADEVRTSAARVRCDAEAEGMTPCAATDFARDVTLLLGLVLGRLANRMSTACVWNAQLGLVEQTFIQNNAIALPWDFAEANPLSASSGSWRSQLDWVARVVERGDPAAPARAVRADAREVPAELAGRSVVVSTDPPYFDYFLYSSLSRYFHRWLRLALREVTPDLLDDADVPTDGEVVSRGGPLAAQGFLADLTRALTAISSTASPQVPITIYYGYKAGDSAAWAAFLGAVRDAGLVVTATWPMRTERPEGVKTGRNSVASSLLVVCRRRPDGSGDTTLDVFRRTLHDELPAAVRRLQSVGVAPVDLDQCALGPGLAAYTAAGRVLDGARPVPPGEALALGARALDAVLTEQAAALDPAVRASAENVADALAEHGDAAGSAELAASGLDLDDVRRAAHVGYRAARSAGDQQRAARWNRLGANLSRLSSLSRLPGNQGLP